MRWYEKTTFKSQKRIQKVSEKLKQSFGLSQGVNREKHVGNRKKMLSKKH